MTNYEAQREFVRMEAAATRAASVACNALSYLPVKLLQEIRERVEAEVFRILYRADCDEAAERIEELVRRCRGPAGSHAGADTVQGREQSNTEARRA